MVKRILINILFPIVSLLCGDLLFIISKSGIIANWGSIIIPSFIIGILWENLFQDNLQSRFRYSIPASIGIIKVIATIIKGTNLTVLAMILILIIYPSVSYYFIKLGAKTKSR